MNRKFLAQLDVAPPLPMPARKVPRDIFGGGDAPSGTTTVNTVQNSDPWAGVQPYMVDIFNRAQGLANRGPYAGQYIGAESPYTQQARTLQANRALQGSPVGDAMQTNIADTLNGQYLNPESNPYLKSAVQDALGLAQSQMIGTYGGPAGSQLSNSGLQEQMTRTLGQIANNAYGSQYNNERARQIQAAALAPNAAALDYADIGQLAGAGASQEGRTAAEIAAAQAQWQSAWGNLANYQSGITGAGNFGTTTGSSSQPYFTNPMSSALGLGMGGLSLYNGLSGAGFFGPSNPLINGAILAGSGVGTGVAGMSFADALMGGILAL